MNFTREPIIETVITPREGCKLVVRSSKGSTQEDYFVDAVEVVSFGHSFFFRSQERPKSFLVPVSDYEILELKETRMVLKNAASDRSIKIGGGREASPRAREEGSPDVLSESRPAPEAQPADRKRENKRRRGRRGRDRPQEPSKSPEVPKEGTAESKGAESEPPEDLLQSEASAKPAAEGKEKAPSFISKLFPPPQTLIKESLSRYKPAESEVEEVPLQEKPPIDETIFEHPTPIEKKLEDENEE